MSTASVVSQYVRVHEIPEQMKGVEFQREIKNIEKQVKSIEYNQGIESAYDFLISLAAESTESNRTCWKPLVVYFVNNNQLGFSLASFIYKIFSRIDEKNLSLRKFTYSELLPLVGYLVAKHYVFINESKHLFRPQEASSACLNDVVEHRLYWESEFNL
ncbi:MAG: hypothetical protein FJZ56_05680 [Chlamydiae bacterium]|nr:hypothetical protein [Chlamydiota bacterium]